MSANPPEPEETTSPQQQIALSSVDEMTNAILDNAEKFDTEEMMDDLQQNEDSTLSEGGGDDVLSTYRDDDLEFDKSRGAMSRVYDGIPIEDIFKNKQINDARIKFKSVPVAPNKGMPSPVEFDELGEITGFTIATNDKLMVLNCEYKDVYGELVVISDSSTFEMAQVGRGMTSGEAASQFPTSTHGVVSRDISGYKSDIFPFLMRYDDSIKLDENDTEESIQGNIEKDRVFVVNFEPNPPIKYTHFKLDVYNVSSTTTKYVHYFEIRRRVYRDLTNINVDKDIVDVITGDILKDQPTNYLKGEKEQRTDAILEGDLLSDVQPQEDVFNQEAGTGDDIINTYEAPINPNTGEVAEVFFTNTGKRRRRGPTRLEFL